IELLVVISIITLLISLLLPAVGEARRQARIATCASNMKQHAQAEQNFEPQNKDRLPNAPEGNNNAAIGRRGIPVARLAIRDAFETNGWGFPGGMPAVGVFQATNGVNSAIANSSLVQGYITVLGPYLVDGEGIDMLQNVLICPSNKIRFESTKTYKDTVRANAGEFPSLSSSASQNAAFSSYRMSVDMLLTPALFDVDRDYGAVGTFQFTPQKWQRFNKASDVFFPSNKAAFFLWFASHDRNVSYWMESGATCPVALHDGSVRVTKPTTDGLSADWNENAGAAYTFNPTGPVYDSYFFATFGGLHGRDL
ncbi:MAG: hypothetical protein KDA21_11845, partial [Phycisphaerales bacterium]|nr:hypothetical protein [Phycisphaerales bacterium]